MKQHFSVYSIKKNYFFPAPAELEEICLYKVENGRVVLEQFIY